MILTGRTDAIDSYIDREEFFDFLPKYFSVEISVHNKCFKYEDADIFVYEENAQEVFMAYMDYDSELQVHEPIQPSIVTGVTNLPVVSARELASPNGSAPAQVNANVQPQRDQDQAQYQGNQMQGY